MLNEAISNISSLERSYEKSDQRIDDLTKELKEDLEDKIINNPIHQKMPVWRLLIWILAETVLITIALKFGKVFSWLWGGVSNWLTRLASLDEEMNADISAFLLNSRKIGNIRTFFLCLVIAAVVYVGWLTALKVYSRVIEGYRLWAAGIEKEAHKRVLELKDKKTVENIVANITDYKDYETEEVNDLGNIVIRFKKTVSGMNGRAAVIKAAGGAALALFACIFFMRICVLKLNGAEKLTIECGVYATLLYLFATAFINLFQFCLGQFFGVISRYIGIGMAVIYGVAIHFYYCRVLEGGVFSFGTGLLLPVFQAAAMILTVLLSHYSIERENWDKGFRIVFKYGNKPAGTKWKLCKRIALSTGITLIMCVWAMHNIIFLWRCIPLMFLWHCSNCLFKRHGSYLYAFWGKWRAIANEFVVGAMLFTSIYFGRRTMKPIDFLWIAVALLIPLLIRLIFRAICKLFHFLVY